MATCGGNYNAIKSGYIYNSTSHIQNPKVGMDVIVTMEDCYTKHNDCQIQLYMGMCDWSQHVNSMDQNI